MTTAKNLRPVLERIATAGTPPKFTLEFLKSLGFASSSDRPVIGVLKGMGFLNREGVPTERYNTYRDANRRGSAVAEGLREGWSPVFLADPLAYEKTHTQLIELFKSVSGKGESVAQKMARTFKTLSDMADWSANIASPNGKSAPETSDSEREVEPHPGRSSARVALHHDVHVHLPPTSDVSVYTAIFRALRSELLD